MALENPSFETGDLTGWTVQVIGTNELGPVAVVSEPGYADSGSYACKIGADPPDAMHDTAVINNYKFHPAPGSTVSIAARVRSTQGKKGNAFGSIGLKYTYSDGTTGMVFSRELATNEMRDGFVNLNFSVAPPSNVVAVQMLVRGRLYQTDRAVYFDSCVIGGDEITGDAVELRFPTNGSVYKEGDVIPFRVTARTGIEIASLNYLVTNTATADVVTIAGTGAEFKADYSLLPKGSYSVVAEAALVGGLSITTQAHTFTVGDAAVVPQREYKASNAYTHLIMRDFKDLSSTMPATAVVTGAQLEVDYRVTFLIRCKDKDVDTIDAARYEAAFQIAPTGVLSAQVLAPNGGAYSAVGNAVTGKQPFVMSDFSVVDNGASEGKRWVALDSGSYKMVLGAEDSVFGLQEVQAGNFLDYAMGLRFYPQLGTVPSYTDDGDMCVRVRLNKVRLKVYFDGGSIEYYFVDNTNPSTIIKGELASAYVQEGSLRLGTASGFMQLLPDLTYASVAPEDLPTIRVTDGLMWAAVGREGVDAGIPVLTDLDGVVNTAFDFTQNSSVTAEIFAGMQRGNSFLFVGNIDVAGDMHFAVTTDATGAITSSLMNNGNISGVTYGLMDYAVNTGQGVAFTVPGDDGNHYFHEVSIGADGKVFILADDGQIPFPLRGPDGLFIQSSYPSFVRATADKSKTTWLHTNLPWVSVQWTEATYDVPAPVSMLHSQGYRLPEYEGYFEDVSYNPFNPVVPRQGAEGVYHVDDPSIGSAIQLMTSPYGTPIKGSAAFTGITGKIQAFTLDKVNNWLYFAYATDSVMDANTTWRVGRVAYPTLVLDEQFTYNSVQNEGAVPAGSREILQLVMEQDTGRLIIRHKEGTAFRTATPDAAGAFNAGPAISKPAGASGNFFFVQSEEAQPAPTPTPPSTDPVIKAGFDIHSALPPTEKNWIGRVANDMRYNGLPTYDDVDTNRSRYMFISANFYGDPDLDSLYGANGVFRAFSYNGEYFYHIATHPEEAKDKARHLAYHHGHLALGFQSGRVDLSVVGEPYNFDGAEGASSWAIGDEVTGLLPLSGTMLGIFGRKSITGLSGTTVDNFATQTISPKLGAVEYTVTDMGFPVYANAYGIYTLSQTSEYGDFLGTPMSQQVSPWLRPRLIRSSNSEREVVVAWPVRSKNQYKLGFADGYILTMTINYGNQSAPTFSKQKYFVSNGPYGGEGGDAPAPYDLSRPALVFAAVSSELDDSGEERIHVANKPLPDAGGGDF